jgi:hypothetical protein
MKQEILCMECAEKSMRYFGVDTVDRDGEGVKHVTGAMKLAKPTQPLVIGIPGHEYTEVDYGSCVCDHCVKPLPVGTRCVARSMWSPRAPYHPWESEYLAVEQ